MKGLLGRLNWGAIAALLFVLSFWSCLAMAQQDTPAQMMSFQELDMDLGTTICFKGRMSSFVRIGISPEETAVTTAHEMKHQEQAARFNNDCERFAAWYATPVGTLMSEAEAYMAGYCVGVKLGYDPLRLWQDYADRIGHYLGSDANRMEVLEAMNKYDKCPEVLKKAVVSDTSLVSSWSIMPGWGQ